MSCRARAFVSHCWGLLLIIALLFSASSYATNEKNNVSSNKDKKHSQVSQVVLKTNFGDITIELNHRKSPITVANFLQYAHKGFYDGTLFHRVIEDFMIQGGGFDKQLQRKEPGSPIQNEATNGLKNLRGTLAMARNHDKHSATSQFFINLADNTHLDHRNHTDNGYGYAVFAKVISGMNVVDKIAKVPTGEAGPFYGDVPATPVILQKVIIP